MCTTGRALTSILCLLKLLRGLEAIAKQNTKLASTTCITTWFLVGIGVYCPWIGLPAS